MKILRTFVAIELSENIRQAIKTAQDYLKTLDCDMKWVRPEIAHLTLKFLGDVTADKIQTIEQALRESVQDLQPIQTQLTSLGLFPDIRRPRILWIGTEDKEGRIQQLAESVETALGHRGFKKENREFRPHVTIGRLRSPKNADKLAEAVRRFCVPSGISQSINAVTLFQSTLTPQGPVYNLLRKIVLHHGPSSG